MNKILLEVIGISYCGSQSGAYALLLRERNAEKQLPIIIGGTEAQAIAMALENVDYSRPLTHDLLKNIADRYSVNVTEVVISKFKNGLFFSELHCEHDGTTSVFDARPSDAIALALRFNAPIYTYSNIIEEAGINSKDIDADNNTDIDFDTDTDTDFDYSERDHYSLSIEDLDILLQDAVNEEDYESAARLRDIINEKRKH